MLRNVMIMSVMLGCCVISSTAAFENDLIKTWYKDLQITFLGHGSLLFQWNEVVIYVDPWSELADYMTLPKADLILITHDHSDHLDLEAIEALRKPRTHIVVHPVCFDRISGSVIMKNGDSGKIHNVTIQAVPAYNIEHKDPEGKPYHCKGYGNGYVLTISGIRIYVAGDTENIPEMKDLKDIRIAFLPMNLPYTMTPEMVAEAAKIIHPLILYPYHFGDTDPSRLVELLKSTDIEVRIRNMK